jgi:hypothetical protein
MRREFRILLHCARHDLSPGGADDLRALLTDDLDWDFLVRTATMHGLMPLLYRFLSSHGANMVPPAILDDLRGRYRSNAQRSVVATGTLLSILDLFTAHDIPAIPLKGPVLARAVYGDESLRSNGDLDILIHREDLRAATDLLEARGYAPEHDLTDEQRSAHTNYAWSLDFAGPEGAIPLDLHWHVTYPHFVSFDAERLWVDLDAIRVADRDVPIFARETLLLVLCVHASKHRWQWLESICCIGELLRSEPPLDWDRVLSEATAAGSRRMLLLGLRLARDLTDTPLPAWVSRLVDADRVVARLASTAQRRLLADAQQEPERDRHLNLFDLRLRERPSDRLRHIWHEFVVPTPNEWALVTLPRRLRPLYYLVRPLRLAVKYGRRPFKRTSAG